MTGKLIRVAMVLAAAGAISACTSEVEAVRNTALSRIREECGIESDIVDEGVVMEDREYGDDLLRRYWFEFEGEEYEAIYFNTHSGGVRCPGDPTMTITTVPP